MNEVINIVGNPYVLGLFFAYWTFNAAVEAMPAPIKKDGRGYHWLYRFLNILSGNVQEAFSRKIPGASK